MTMPALRVHFRHSLLLLAASILSACQPHANRYEPFWQNRFESLVRSVQTAQKAQVDAADELARCAPLLDGLVAAPDSDASYHESRRLVARCDSRTRTARVRIDNLRESATNVFDQWRREIREYDDSSLRRQSDQERTACMQRYEAALKSLEAARDSLDAPLLSLKDDDLYLKHRRNLRDPPPPAYSNQGPRDRGVALMLAAVAAANAECDRFFTFMPAPRHVSN